jgi:hypothetical protein
VPLGALPMQLKRIALSRLARARDSHIAENVPCIQGVKADSLSAKGGD